MDVDGDGLSEAGRAGVGAGVAGARVLDDEVARRDLALLRDDTHATSRRVVRDYLEEKL